MKKLTIFLALLLFVGFTVQAQMQISGTVTGADDGLFIPGVSIAVKDNMSIGTSTDMDGKFNLTVPSNTEVLVVSFVGMKTQEVVIGGRSVIDIQMVSDVLEMDEVVVTALGITRAKKTLAFAAQEVQGNDLNITSDANIKSALVGKVAGIQLVGQAGSKLGEAGRIRIRGAISMTSDGDPLYVVDGVPTTDPNIVDMDNVANVNVLKGPTATALYGQRAQYGVIMITTKMGKKSGVTVEFTSSTTFDKVAYLPNYQNEYGGGYDGEGEWITMDFAAGTNWFGDPYPAQWSVFDGEKYIANGYADESWGPKFDGSDYIPWYAWWDDSPYFGQTAKWEAQPDNIKDFYDTGVNMKNTIAINGSGENYSGRLAFTNYDQTGIIPYSGLKRNMISTNFQFNPTDKLQVSAAVNYSAKEIEGDFDDGYSNQVTGSFNAWFARNVSSDKMRELKDLKTNSGYHASWNYWGPELGIAWGSEKGGFWFNPYFYLEEYNDIRKTNDLMGSISLDYKIAEGLTITGNASTNTSSYSRYFEVPFSIEAAADPDLYNVWNSGFGNQKRETVENNFGGRLNYNKMFGDLSLDATLGGLIRTNSFNNFQANMPTDSKTQGLYIPDAFVYGNTKLPVSAGTHKWNKQVNSLYGKVTLGYRNFAYLDVNGRKDWSSALPAENNGYFYPSFGASVLISELIDFEMLSYGKIRAGWGQVGSDVGAMMINPAYPLASNAYMGIPQQYTYTTQVDPNIKPSLNTSFEVGFDTKFFLDLVGLSFTYYNETRKDEIIPIAMSTATGYTNFLTNAGQATRSGIELILSGTPVKTKSFTWDISVNFATSNSVIDELPGDMESMAAPGGSDDWDFVSMTHELGGNWGQLRGRGLAVDADGNKIINSETGTYVFETGKYFGSVLPDYTGGILNQFTLFNMIDISASIDFQKGGKFFSLTEMWGQYSGLLEETAETNDNGMNIRDAIADGGGVHVTGVDETGAPYDEYMDAVSYFAQFNANSIAEPFIHDATYIKLRDLSLSFRVPTKVLNNTFISSASVGFIARNVWLISVADDNIHGWDPSELSQAYGENAQLPGTRSYGFNVKLTF